MTQPVQEPTQGRVNQGQEFRTRQLFRRPASSALEWEADGNPVGQQLFPTFFPRSPVVSGAGGHRRWPGGVIVVSAETFNVNGTVGNNANQNSLTINQADEFKIVTENQLVDASVNPSVPSAGTTTFSFTPADVGLIPTMGYRVFVCWRWATGGTFFPRCWVSNDADLDGWNFATGAGGASDFFGFAAVTGGGNSTLVWDTAATAIDIRVGYSTGGGGAAGDVDVDYFVFIPDGTVPNNGSVVTLVNSPTPLPPYNLDVFQYVTMNPYQGPTYAYEGTTYHAPFSSTAASDSQMVRGPLDPDFNWTMGSYAPSTVEGWAKQGGFETGNVTYPRHVYVAARLEPLTGSDMDGVWLEEGFVTYGSGATPKETAPVITCSWHLLYMGCYPFYEPDSGAVALWHPDDSVNDARSPFVNNSALHTVWVDLSAAAVSSFMDQIVWNE